MNFDELLRRLFTILSKKAIPRHSRMGSYEPRKTSSRRETSNCYFFKSSKVHGTIMPIDKSIGCKSKI